MTQSTNTLKTTKFQAAELTVRRGSGENAQALTRGVRGHGQVIPFPVPRLPIEAEAEPTTTPPPDNRVGERMLAVVSMSDLTHAERSVLSVIAYHDGPGGAWPSFQTIADKVGLSRSRVSALVAEIERKGRLVRKKTQRTNLYTVHYELQVRPLKKTPRYDFSTGEIPELENPAVSETVTAEIVDNSENKKSCRLGNRDSAVSETETGTGNNRKTKDKGTSADALALDPLSQLLILKSDPKLESPTTEPPSRSAEEISAHAKLLASANEAVSPYRFGPEVKVTNNDSLRMRDGTPKATPKALPRKELEALATELRIKFEPDMSDAALTELIREGGYSGTTRGRKG